MQAATPSRNVRELGSTPRWSGARPGGTGGGGTGRARGSLLGCVAGVCVKVEERRFLSAEPSIQAAWLSFVKVPIYEYKCPQGHVFEVFQRMSDPPPEACEICGEGPMQRVLFPVAVHFKGSGFYSTDYGRSGRQKETSQDGDKPATDKADNGEKKDTKKKVAET
jgi:putative FmdB family regulatory protein